MAILTKKKLAESKNYYLLKEGFLGEGSYFLPAENTGEFLNDFGGGDVKVLFLGEVYSNKEALKLKMVELFGEEKARAIMMAYSQNITQSAQLLIAAFPGGYGLLNGKHKTEFKCVDGAVYLDVSLTQIEMRELDDSIEGSAHKVKFIIPGTVTIRYIFDPIEKKFQRHYVDASTALLEDICMGKKNVSELTAEEVAVYSKKPMINPTESGRPIQVLPKPVASAFDPSNQVKSGSIPSSPSPRSNASTPRVSATQETPSAPKKTITGRSLEAIRINRGLVSRLFDSDKGGIDIGNLPPNAAMQFVLVRLEELCKNIPFPDELYSKSMNVNGGLVYAKAIGQGIITIPSEFENEDIPDSLKGELPEPLQVHVNQIFDAMRLLAILGRDLLFEINGGKFQIKPDFQAQLKLILGEEGEIQESIETLFSSLKSSCEQDNTDEDILNDFLKGYFSALIAPLVKSEKLIHDPFVRTFLTPMSDRVTKQKPEEIFREIRFSDYQAQLQEEAAVLPSVIAESFENSINEEKRNLVDLIQESALGLGCQGVLINGIEVYLEILKKLNNSLFAEETDSVDEAAMWQRLLARKMSQIKREFQEHFQELKNAGVKNLPEYEAVFNALSRLQVKASQMFINHAIINIVEYGVNIPEGSEKKPAYNELVKSLVECSSEFYKGNDFSQARKDKFHTEFSNKIAEKQEALSIPRGLWARMLEYVAAAFRSLTKPKQTPAAQHPVAAKNSPRLFKTRSIKLTEEAKQTAKAVLSF